MCHVMRKPTICICENKGADQLRSNCEADQRLCFAAKIVQSFFHLNPKFQASSLLLRLYRCVCLRPGRKSEDWFSRITAHYCDNLACILLSANQCIGPGSNITKRSSLYLFTVQTDFYCQGKLVVFLIPVKGHL